MSSFSHRFCQFTGSLLLLSAGVSPASADLLGGLIGSSTDEATTQADQTSDRPLGFFSEPFAEPTIIVDGQTVETDEKCLGALHRG